ncbi:MAG: hypothetical protein ACXWQQ_15100, partial [Pseudobdellovibrio sp.]
MSRLKKIIIFIAFAAILAVGILLNRSNEYRVPFNYFAVDCSIYDKNLNLLLQTNGMLCDYSQDGKIITADPHEEKLELKDKNDAVIWSVDEKVHHDLKFTEDQNYFLTITSEVIPYKGSDVRSDCFSKRTLKNEVVY